MALSDSFEFFRANLDAFYRVFGEQSVAIKDCKVIGFGDNNVSLWQRMVEQGHQAGTFIVQKCGKDESCFTVNFPMLYQPVSSCL